MASSVTDVDKGYTARLRAIASLNGSVTAKVGVIGEQAAKTHDPKSGMSNGELAATHEFGLGVPQRSFVRGWVDEQKPRILEELKTEAHAVLRGQRDIYRAMDRFGQWGSLKIVSRIAGFIPPPLSPVTIARKGHALPLVDTGELIRSIDSAVERRGVVLS